MKKIYTENNQNVQKINKKKDRYAYPIPVFSKDDFIKDIPEIYFQ